MKDSGSSVNFKAVYSKAVLSWRIGSERFGSIGELEGGVFVSFAELEDWLDHR